MGLRLEGAQEQITTKETSRVSSRATEKDTWKDEMVVSFRERTELCILLGDERGEICIGISFETPLAAV
jgi:hypothetical protein